MTTEPDILSPRLLIAAYCQGLFPMALDDDEDGEKRIGWYSPDPRGVIPLDRFNCPRSLRRRLRDRPFDIRLDTAFREVIEACAAPRPDSPGTWIDEQIIRAYSDLHAMGLAHSVEAWREGKLVGGLYGVAIRGAFFGESMFHHAHLGGTDASKICLVHLVHHLNRHGFVLLDTQWTTPHLEQFGATEIPREQYLAKLAHALTLEVEW